MNAEPQPIPDGYTTVTPWVIGRDIGRFIDFVVDTLGAEDLGRVDNHDGTIGHAEVRIGDAIVMMFDAFEGWPATPQFLRLYVEDCRAAYDRIMDNAGGRSVTEPTLLAWGDAVARVADPWGTAGGSRSGSRTFPRWRSARGGAIPRTPT